MKIALVCAAAIALSLAACSSNSSSTSTNTAAPEASAMATQGAMTSSTGGSMMANMHAKTMTIVMKALNGSGESGTATLTAMGPKTRVNIGLKGENTTGDQPAHIHAGHCPDPGAVKYPLKNVVLGKSNTVVGAPMASLTGGNMSINVHESAKNLARYVACGDIK